MRIPLSIIVSSLCLTAGCFIQPAPIVGTSPPPTGVSTPAPDAHGAIGPSGTLTPWNGPIACAATEDLVIRNADINLASGNGPTVLGSCDIWIENSRIIANNAGVLLQGSGDIVIRQSYVQGRTGAVVSMGSGDVKIENSHLVGAVNLTGSGDIAVAGSLVEGRIVSRGSGDVQDLGGNQWQ
ncbi:MAG: right-handed parallel beta-helix repeat-containing protein [Myxococcota bacterium]